MPTSTFTPLELMTLPSRAALRDEFVGRSLSELRTPALVIDRKAFEDNCRDMRDSVNKMGIKFRAHIKTHKTPEGARLQADAGAARALIASTMPEVWGILESGLAEEGKIDDILYSLPVSADRLEDLNAAQEKAGKGVVIRVMVDHAEQVKALAEAAKRLNRSAPWSVFIKVNGGGNRAGAPPRSAQMRELIEAAAAEPSVDIYGFYSHFGQSYASKDLEQAGGFYAGEVECVNDAAAFARELGVESPLVLSVGATPTAHAAALGAETGAEKLHGELELHAGCYCLNDLQQLATSLVRPGGAALSVLATVVSRYDERGAHGEAMCDAGALAVSKDSGPTPGFGRVVAPVDHGWSLGRISQEHGTLTRTDPNAPFLPIGTQVRIIPQHACLACACYPWFYIVDGDSDTVADVWVPWKGW